MFRTWDIPVWWRVMEYSHPDNRGCKISRNVGNILPADRASYRRVLQSLSTQLRAMLISYI